MTDTASHVGSPLAEIERLALEQANDLNITVSVGESTELREIVVDVVDRWRADFRRGQRPIDLAEPAAIVERAMQNLTGYGPLASLLDDDDVWEIMVNAPDSLFVKRHSGLSGYHNESFHDDAHVHRIITRILDRSSGAHRDHNRTRPIIA
ncbi:MAG: hypothetical protein EX269_13965, partial [Acidimicrobiales bacterium]